MNIHDKIRADIAKAETMWKAGELTFDDVRILPGNKKTGRDVFTVSLMPVVDCTCTVCAGDCYDLAHDVISDNCRWLRAVNHVAHSEDPSKYWATVFRKFSEAAANLGRKGRRVALRINVGGDVSYTDLCMIRQGMRQVPAGSRVLLFTKNYSAFAEFCRSIVRENPQDSKWPDGLHVVVSRWPTVPDPRDILVEAAPKGYHYIESVIRWGDRVPRCLKGCSDDAREELARSDREAGRLFPCPGNCGICLAKNTGCFSTKLKGVCIDAH